LRLIARSYDPVRLSEEGPWLMSRTAGKSPAFFQVWCVVVGVAAVVVIAGCLGHGALTAASHKTRLASDAVAGEAMSVTRL
jgi:hypothetical protein